MWKFLLSKLQVWLDAECRQTWVDLRLQLKVIYKQNKHKDVREVQTTLDNELLRRFFLWYLLAVDKQLNGVLPPTTGVLIKILYLKKLILLLIFVTG